MKLVILIFCTLFILTSCVEEIPVDQLEQETFSNNNTAPEVSLPPVIDKTAPSILNVLPSGVLPATTTSISLSVRTNEKAICQYDTSNAFSGITTKELSASSDGLNHSSQLLVEADQKYIFYVSCIDGLGNKTLNPSIIDFSIDKKGVEDKISPLISGLMPTGKLGAGTKTAKLEISTNEAAICKYSENQALTFDQMTGMSSVNGLSHEVDLSGLSDGAKYSYSFLCKDLAGNTSLKASLSFEVETLLLDGKILYANNCMSCHQVLENSTKKNKTASVIQNAILGNAVMKNLAYLKALAPAQVEAIARVLVEEDKEAPKVISISESEITKDSARITWKLDEAGDGQIQYGKTVNYGQATNKITSFTLDHSQVIANLEQDTVYHYRILSTDKSGNSLISEDRIFKTLGVVNQPPTISVDKKSGIVEAGQQIVFTFQASDPEGKALDWSFNNKPKFTGFVNTGTQVVITFSPAVADIGDYNGLTMSVKDVEGLSAAVSFDLKVIAAVPMEQKFTKFKAVMDKSCVSCHGAPGSQFGGLASFYNKTEDYWSNSRFISGGDAQGSLLYQRLKKEYTNFVAPGGLAQNMPTNGGNGFNQADADVIKDYINSLSSTSLDCATVATTPSLTEVRRLNKDELKNAIRDLFGSQSIINLAEIDKLPLDGNFDGFSTVGIRQQTSKTFVNLYQDAIEKIADGNINKIINCTASQACIESILYPLARRAWSKELTSLDQTEIKAVVNSILNNTKHSFSFADGINSGMRYILMSPQFIYAVHESAGQEKKIDTLNDYEVAKKLALFLWKSIPDTKLLDVAKNESLVNSAVLVRETKRMLADSRFTRSRDVFVDEWLRLGRLDSVTPSQNIYGVSSTQFNTLKPMMKREVKEYVGHIFDNKMPLDTFINGKFTVVNKTLADHYGLNHPGGDYQKINLQSDGERGGISTLGGIIAMNSNTNRRSIVLSGVWFLNAMLCDDPATPGNDIAAEVAQALASDAPHRDLAGERASNQSCVGCHGAIDGAGLPFNTFDSVGRMTNVDEKGRSVDSFGEIYLKEFNNTHEFLEVIKKEDKFKACLTNKMLIYATGEMLDPKNEVNDRCKAKKISDNLTGTKDNLEELVMGIVQSENFLKRNVP